MHGIQGLGQLGSQEVELAELQSVYDPIEGFLVDPSRPVGLEDAPKDRPRRRIFDPTQPLATQPTEAERERPEAVCAAAAEADGRSDRRQDME